MMDIEVDEALGILGPIVLYWVYSGIYMFLGDSPSWEKYRLHAKGEEDVKNLVTKWQVVKGVLLQQAIQIIVALFVLAATKDEIRAQKKLRHSPVATALQLAIATVVMDTWQYFMHRYMHINRFLYKHIHSKHHELVVPYAIGALYNHPVEGLLLDTGGGALAFLLSGISPFASVFFFCFATIKTIDDHCGLLFPGNPIQTLFSNNSAYHSIHHQLYGQKYNFSQPFFVVWDKILGTHMNYSLVERKDGGFEARPVKD